MDTENKILDWVKNNIKKPCYNCNKIDFTVSDQYGTLSLIDYDTPVTGSSPPSRFLHTIVVHCKNCGLMQLYDANIAAGVRKLILPFTSQIYLFYLHTITFYPLWVGLYR